MINRAAYAFAETSGMGGISNYRRPLLSFVLEQDRATRSLCGLKWQGTRGMPRSRWLQEKKMEGPAKRSMRFVPPGPGFISIEENHRWFIDRPHDDLIWYL